MISGHISNRHKDQITRTLKQPRSISVEVMLVVEQIHNFRGALANMIGEHSPAERHI
jgi:hypothetical protein